MVVGARRAGQNTADLLGALPHDTQNGPKNEVLAEAMWREIPFLRSEVRMGRPAGDPRAEGAPVTAGHNRELQHCFSGTSNLDTNTSSKAYPVKRLAIVHLACECVTATNCYQATGLTNLVINPQDVASLLQPGKPSVSGVVSREGAGQATRGKPDLLRDWPGCFASRYESVNDFGALILRLLL